MLGRCFLLPPAASAASGFIRRNFYAGPGSGAREVRRSSAVGTFPLDSNGMWAWCFVPNYLA